MEQKPNQNSDLREIPHNINELQSLVGIISRGKQMWEATFDAIRDPVLIIDDQYKVVRSNLAAAHQGDLPIREFIGKTCYESFLHRSSPCPDCPLQETLKNKTPHFSEAADLRTENMFRLNSYPLISEFESGLPLAVHHYRNVTEEKRLQKKLIQSEKMAAIGLLAGGVAHEINNPLAGILAFTQILKREVQGDSLLEDLNEIEEAAKRCKKIVEDLLAFSRPHPQEELAPLRLDREVDRVLPLARLQLKHFHSSLVTHYESESPSILGSSARLHQVFLNLIHNAVQSMKHKNGGQVTIRVGADPERKNAFVEFIDEGCGISEKDLEKIFDPFFTTKDHGEGTGLGLSICESIINEHGGRIEVESKLGKGSLFRVILPVTA